MRESHAKCVRLGRSAVDIQYNEKFELKYNCDQNQRANYPYCQHPHFYTSRRPVLLSSSMARNSGCPPARDLAARQLACMHGQLSLLNLLTQILNTNNCK